MARLSYTCVIFDLDGTLVNTIADIALAVNHALTSFGERPLEESAYPALVGNGIKTLALNALPPESKDKAESVQRAAFDYYASHPVDKAVVYDGIEETLHELKSLRVKTAVLTNKPDAIARLVIARLFEAELFDRVFGERQGFPRKPDPSLGWDLLAELDKAPHQTLFVGDSEVDMAAAKNIGCLPVGVKWGFRSLETLQNAGAAVIIEEPREILDIITGKRRV